MKPLNSPLWAIGTIVLAALAAWGVSSLSQKNHHVHSHAPSEENTLHDWLHANLSISPEQEKFLLPIELAYEEESARCHKEIAKAGLALAEAIRNSSENSSEIESARMKLQEAKGRLEEITLEHFFAMKKHLDPEQGEKLLQWTHDSLIHGNRY